MIQDVYCGSWIATDPESATLLFFRWIRDPRRIPGKHPRSPILQLLKFLTCIIHAVRVRKIEGGCFLLHGLYGLILGEEAALLLHGPAEDGQAHVSTW
jgi:hypothetical protein